MLGLLLVAIVTHMNHSGIKGKARYFRYHAYHSNSLTILCNSRGILLAESFLRTEQSKLARLGALWLVSVSSLGI